MPDVAVLPALMNPAPAQPIASSQNLALFQPIDRHFARLMERLSGVSTPGLSLAAALLSRSRGEGHTCLDLRKTTDLEFVSELLGAALPERLPDPESWVADLRKSPAVGRPGEFRPLILDAKGRLYLQRFWAAETELAQAILARARAPLEPLDEPLLRDGFRRLFPGLPPSAADCQMLAAATAVRRKLAVISGGPGTGKTRTVAILLALMLEQAGTERCRIALAAPTGKAAARLQESIHRLKLTLDCAESIKARLPLEAFTVHRLLGVMPDSGLCRFDAANPLPFEVVVVDEASMVDLSMMARLFAAVPPGARLLLLGDPDQLASVEAGAVLGDLCLGAGRSGALPSCIVRLEKNYRFGPNHGLLALSRAVNAGDAETALRVLRAGDQGLSAHALPAPARLRPALKDWVLESFGDAVRTPEPFAALQALSRARLLVALRQGPVGLERINSIVEEILAAAGLLNPENRWYAGRPVLITRNDYHLGLFNGDVGILLPDAPGRGTRAWFVTADGTLKSYPPLRLPEHETAFAMTVHKSQGSEFESVLLLLPERPSPVLTRELLYTGVTRASKRLALWFPEPVFRAAVARRAERPSGLREALWGEADPASAPKGNQLELGIEYS